MATARPASSGTHRLPRGLIATGGAAGTGHGAVTARRLLCAAAGAAGPGEPLGAGGRGSGAGGVEDGPRPSSLALRERQQAAGGSAAGTRAAGA